jgi:hypothetical protein
MSRSPALLLCALAGFGAQGATAAQEPVDADLLEFLGSIGEDDDWQDFLEQKPVKAAAGKAAKDAQKTPVKASDASSAAAASKEKDK